MSVTHGQRRRQTLLSECIHGPSGQTTHLRPRHTDIQLYRYAEQIVPDANADERKTAAFTYAEKKRLYRFVVVIVVNLFLLLIFPLRISS